jgi:hypothetical protein
VSAWLALVAVQLGPCGVRLVREARGDAMSGIVGYAVGFVMGWLSYYVGRRFP